MPKPHQWPPLRVLGLTGGIASGKSTFAAWFAECGAEVIDADAVGREIVAPGEPALAELAAAFGPEVLLADGSLDRQAVGRRVFARAKDLAALNAITHPRIAARLESRLRALQARKRPMVVVIEAAVLLEARWERWVDAVAVVRAQPSTQVARLIGGRGYSPSDADARVRSQLPLEERLKAADFVLDGEATAEAAVRQVQSLVGHPLLRLATGGDSTR